jgi:hypothetical protein
MTQCCAVVVRQSLPGALLSTHRAHALCLYDEQAQPHPRPVYATNSRVCTERRTCVRLQPVRIQHLLSTLNSPNSVFNSWLGSALHLLEQQYACRPG